MLGCPAIRPSDWLAVDVPSAHSWKSYAPKRDIDYCLTERCVHVVPKNQMGIERTFRKNVAALWRDTAKLSSPSDIAAHESYRAILDMGDDAVPYLLRDMQENRRTWFRLLAKITQENPVTDSDIGKPDRMINAWLHWGRARGRL
jgi:hypothetical protein